MALMGHCAFNSKKIYFVLITLFIEYRKELAKITAKSLEKLRQLSKTHVSDFKLECAKMFLMNFCQQSSNFKRKFRSVLECPGRVTKINPSLSLRALKTKG